MKMFFSFLSAVVLVITLFSCEGRMRRQIWPAPNDPNFYWDDQGDDRDFFQEGGSWLPRSPRIDRPPRFDEPVRYNEPMRYDQPMNHDDPMRYDQPSMSQNIFRDDFNFIDNGSGTNQNRRTTTEALGPIRTIHVAPQGCDCPMTQQFNPVCGTDGNTYRNKGLLNCYARCGTNVSQKRLGTC